MSRRLFQQREYARNERRENRSPMGRPADRYGSYRRNSDRFRGKSAFKEEKTTGDANYLKKRAEVQKIEQEKIQELKNLSSSERKHLSRWETSYLSNDEKWEIKENYSDSKKSSALRLLNFLPTNLPQKALKAILIRIRMEEISKRLEELKMYRSEFRKPSPTPVFDKFGKRTNLRITVKKEELEEEAKQLVELGLLINPLLKIPANFKFIDLPLLSKKVLNVNYKAPVLDDLQQLLMPVNTELSSKTNELTGITESLTNTGEKRFSKKLYIPCEEYPNYNFIGLIIGPRGATQKKLERETGTKIAIRGKGSMMKTGFKPLSMQEEPLHVLITGENEIDLKKAIKIVEKLLIPVEEGKNEFKRQQLRQLASYHGTLKDNANMDLQESSIFSQLQDYGKRTFFGNRDTTGHGSEKMQKIDSFFKDKQNKVLNEKLEGEFEKFTKELDGLEDYQPFYKYYDFVQNAKVFAPGTDDLDPLLYSEEKKRTINKKNERREEMDIDSDDDFDYFKPIYPPGTLKEERYLLFLDQQALFEKRKTILEVPLEDPSLKKEEEKKETIFAPKMNPFKKEKKEERPSEDTPPWLM